jgi:hypothetical protein
VHNQLPPTGSFRCPLTCDAAELGCFDSERYQETAWAGQSKERVAQSSATRNADVPGCGPVELDGHPPTTAASVKRPQKPWSTGVELTHIAPIHYEPARPGRNMDRCNHFQTSPVPASFALGPACRKERDTATA